MKFTNEKPRKNLTSFRGFNRTFPCLVGVTVIPIGSFCVNRKGVLISKIIKVTINNWKKYNNSESTKPRRPWWFSCSNHIHIDQDFRNFSHEEKWFWICVLCEASLQGKDTILIDPDYHPVLWGINLLVMYDAIEKLQQASIVSSIVPTTRGKHITLQDITLHTYVVSDKTNIGSNEPHPASAGISVKDFIDAYNQNCKSLPKVQAITEKRKRKSTVVLKEFVRLGFGIDEIKKVVKFISLNDFYSGKNDTGWKADFDFLLQSGKLIELLEKSNASRSNAPKMIKFEDI